MPKFLMMQRPKVENSQDVHLKYIRLKLCDCLRDDSMDLSTQALSDGSSPQLGSHSKRQKTQMVLLSLSKELDEDTRAVRKLDLSIEVQKAIQGALYISNHLKKEDQCQRVGPILFYMSM